MFQVTGLLCGVLSALCMLLFSGPASRPHLSVSCFEAEYEVCFSAESSVFGSPGL